MNENAHFANSKQSKFSHCVCERRRSSFDFSSPFSHPSVVLSLHSFTGKIHVNLLTFYKNTHKHTRLHAPRHHQLVVIIAIITIYANVTYF